MAALAPFTVEPDRLDTLITALEAHAEQTDDVDTRILLLDALLHRRRDTHDKFDDVVRGEFVDAVPT